MTAGLPDSPIGSRVHDQFGRGRLANSVADIIHHAPAGASMRVGIYGDWGEGKTSVLKLIDERLSSSGHICVWVAPWLGKTTDDIWEQLLTNVAEQLNVRTQKFKEARSATQQVQNVRNAASGHWATQMLEGVLGEKLQKSMEKLAEAQREHLVEAIDKELGDRKIVVFVDDLDRTDQALIPKLLMSLRELFDFPDFYYVLALSPRVVETGLANVGFGGEQPNRFLEKIVELPIHLPSLDDKAMSRYITTGIDSIRDVVHVDALRDIVPFMPRNPRRIKLLLRYLASLHGELKRFRKDEISWRKLYLAQMLRLEFPDAARKLAADEKLLSELEYGVSKERAKRLAGADEASTRDEEKYAPQGADDKLRFIALCAAIREEGSFLSGRYGLREMLELVERPPAFTLQAIDSFFAEFTALDSDDAKVEAIERLIGKDESGNPDAERAEAVFDVSLLIRDSQLEQAVESETREELLEHVANANPASYLVELQITAMNLFGRRSLGGDSWVRLYQHGLKWARFHRQRDYRVARLDERRLIRLAADHLPTDAQLRVLEKRPFEPHHHLGGEARAFVAEATQLKAEFTNNVIVDLLQLFEQEEGLEQFWAIEWHTKGKWLLFDQASAFHEPATRRRLFAVARQARHNKDVHKNLLTYLRMLGYGAFEGGSFSTADCRALLQDGEFVKALWRAAMTRPLNPRTAGTLRGYRKLLLQMGLTEEDLPLPAWWLRLERDFFAPITAGEADD